MNLCEERFNFPSKQCILFFFFPQSFHCGCHACIGWRFLTQATKTIRWKENSVLLDSKHFRKSVLRELCKYEELNMFYSKTIEKVNCFSWTHIPLFILRGFDEYIRWTILLRPLQDCGEDEPLYSRTQNISWNKRSMVLVWRSLRNRPLQEQLISGERLRGTDCCRSCRRDFPRKALTTGDSATPGWPHDGSVSSLRPLFNWKLRLSRRNNF